jgi:hypothetical protein
MCYSFWGVPRGDSRLTNQSATWLVYLRGVSISPEKTPKAKTHSVQNLTPKIFSRNFKAAWHKYLYNIQLLRREKIYKTNRNNNSNKLIIKYFINKFVLNRNKGDLSGFCYWLLNSKGGKGPSMQCEAMLGSPLLKLGYCEKIQIVNS